MLYFSATLSTMNFVVSLFLIFCCQNLVTPFFSDTANSILGLFIYLSLIGSSQGYINFINFILRINFWLYPVFCFPFQFCFLLSLPCSLAFCLFFIHCCGSTLCCTGVWLCFLSFYLHQILLSGTLYDTAFSSGSPRYKHYSKMKIFIIFLQLFAGLIVP